MPARNWGSRAIERALSQQGPAGRHHPAGMAAGGGARRRRLRHRLSRQGRLFRRRLSPSRNISPARSATACDGDTVAPTDSSSEEVYALGRKKFLEEAKLLWNLSQPDTPSQHRQRAQPVRDSRHRLHGDGFRKRRLAVADAARGQDIQRKAAAGASSGRSPKGSSAPTGSACCIATSSRPTS